MMRLLLPSILMIALAPGCRKQRPAPAPAQPAVQGEINPEAVAGSGEYKLDEDADDEARGGRSKGKRNHDPQVYLDGVPVVAFTYNEIPSTVPALEYEWEPGEKATRFRICDLVKAVGADCAKVKATHWFGGDERVVTITGDYLRKHKKDAYFDFAHGMGGRPRVQWGSVKADDMIDLVNDMQIYVNKKPPKFNRQDWTLTDDKGHELEGIPYAEKREEKRLTRVNVDGRLVAHIKRNLVEGKLPVVSGTGPDARYRLADLLKENHLTLTRPGTIDLVNLDERVIHLTAEDVAAGIEFSCPRHAHGEMEFHVRGRSVRANVVNIYDRLARPDRPERTLTLGQVARGWVGDPQGTTQESSMISMKAAP